jgi:signal peptidase II
MKKKDYLIIFLIVLFDQVIKLIMNNLLVLGHSYRIVNKFFYLTLTYNTGASWSIMSGQRIILIAISFVLLYFLIKMSKKSNKLMAYVVLIGGLLGNLFDRIFRGYVIDYLHFYIFGYDYPIFNIADICIVVGVFLLIIEIIRGEEK